MCKFLERPWQSKDIIGNLMKHCDESAYSSLNKIFFTGSQKIHVQACVKKFNTIFTHCPRILIFIVILLWFLLSCNFYFLQIFLGGLMHGLPLCGIAID
jgi:hypothetical protein